MATKLNNVALYKSMTSLFREANTFRSALELEYSHNEDPQLDTNKVKNLINEILTDQELFRSSVQKVNSNNIHTGHGRTIKSGIEKFEQLINNIDNSVPNTTNTKTNQKLDALKEAINNLQTEFTKLKG